MRLMQARRRAVTVHESWRSALPGRSRAFWQEVGREAARKGIRSGDVDAIRKLALGMEAMRLRGAVSPSR